MTAPPPAAATSKTIRIIHAALVTGVLLFGLVGHFVMRPSLTAGSSEFPPALLPGLLGVALAVCVLSLVLRRRIPRRPADESADLFWVKAVAPAMITWASLEAASLLSIFLYVRTGSPAAIAVAALAVALFVVFNPANLERR
jgi:hypothetical protein